MELRTKFDENFAVALALVRWQRENTRYIIVFTRLLLFREVANDVTTKRVHLAHDVEEKRVRVVVQRLVIKEQLSQ